jgi:tetratricopeptide (TPR) repeat protein
MSFALALLLAQVGPFPSSGQPAVSPLPPELQDRRANRRKRAAPPAPPLPPVAAAAAEPGEAARACMDETEGTAEQAGEAAEEWLAAASAPDAGAARARARECLGIALGRQGRWDEARLTFLAAQREAAAGEPGLRARLGAMAGNAALAGGDPAGALAALDPARAEAQAAGDPALAGGIALDRARALVALKREAEAEAALAEARTAMPAQAQAWLLSATLSRRLGRLAEAQTQIERAAGLLPVDPEIGLEAGVIAVLSGRDEAARRSWQSVVAAAPQSDAARTARGYIDQLGPAPAPPPAQAETRAAGR